MTVEEYARPLALAVALLGNADELLDDAEVLMTNGRPARALVLSVCAAEELAKIAYCLDALTIGAPIPASNSRAWRDHKDKILSALALDLAFVHQSPTVAVGHIESDAEALFEARMASLYVDHSADAIRSPGQVKFDTAALMERLRANSSLLHTVFDQATPEVFALIAPHLPQMAAAFESRVDKNDLSGTLQIVRSVVAAAASGL